MGYDRTAVSSEFIEPVLADVCDHPFWLVLALCARQPGLIHRWHVRYSFSTNPLPSGHGRPQSSTEFNRSRVTSPVRNFLNVEHLDLFAFGRRPYDDNLLSHLADKYSDKPIGVILSIGLGALDFAVKLRAAAWPATPIVFTALSETAAPPAPPNTTGFFVQRNLADMVKVGQRNAFA